MWVKLKGRKRIEVGGKMKVYLPGDWIDVGKQTAMQWINAGEAEDAASDSRHPAPDKVRKRASEYELQIPAFTLFAVPMSFQRDKTIKQDNALGSWMKLDPRPVVLLFGSEPGIAEAAQRHRCLNLPRVALNEYGTPVVGDAFMQAQRLAVPEDVICYVNSDIILLRDFAKALIAVAKKFDQFLMIGQRWDIDLVRPLRFGDGWQERLRDELAKTGNKHSVGAVDYFAFRPGLYKEIPPFAIGRSAWDNWLLGHAVRNGVPVIDASAAATAIHQDKGADNVMTANRQRERTRNRSLYDRDRAGVTGSIKDASWRIDANGEIVEKTK